jgi:arylsulfatase A-like enzyme
VNTSRPNILFIVVDCLRADHLGCYGYPRPTSPNIDALAAQGAVFEDFFAAGVPTQPSFTTMYTGQRPLTHGIVSHKSDDLLAPGSPWLPSLLRKSGYTTASFCCLARYQQWFVHGFEFLVDSTTRYHDFGYTCETINNRAIPWLRAHADEPFFMVLHYWDPHTPYLPPEKHRLFYEGDPADPSLPDTLAPLKDQYFRIMWSKWFEKLPAGMRDAEYVVSLYDGEVHHADDGVGALLHALDESGHADDTIVMLVSDHGELFYRHDIFFDHHGLYDGNIHCPLIVRGPGVAAGQRIAGFAQHPDLAPTLLDAAGEPIPEAMEGASLLPALGGQEMPSREFITASECTWQKKWAIRTNSEKLILSRQPDFHGMPRVELYDLKADPHELNNIAASQPERTRSLESRLEAWISDEVRRNRLPGDPIMLGDITLGRAWADWIAQGRP